MRPYALFLVAPLLACTFDASGFGEPPGALSDSGVGDASTTTGPPPATSLTDATTTTGGDSGTEGVGEATTLGNGPSGDPTTDVGDPTGPDPMTTSTTGPMMTTGPDETTAEPCEMVELHADGDGDGFGDPNPMQVCADTPGFIEDDSDCNDADPAVYPGVTEKCNDVDDDCDGVVNEYDSTDNKQECGDCRFRIREGRLYYFCDFGQSWDEARAFCQLHGLDLAIASDQGEHDFLWDEVPWDSGMWWIGGGDQAKEGEYVWVDGEAIADDDGRWGNDEPNNSGDNQSNADCMGVMADGFPWPGNDGFGSGSVKKWIDFPCAKGRPFICEGLPP